MTPHLSRFTHHASRITYCVLPITSPTYRGALKRPADKPNLLKQVARPAAQSVRFNALPLSATGFNRRRRTQQHSFLIRNTPYALRPISLLLLLLLLLPACTPSQPPVALANLPTPTINPLFGESGVSADNAGTGLFLEQTAPTFVPTTTRTPAPTPTITPTPSPVPYIMVDIYDDELNPSWTLDNSQGMEFGPRSAPHYTGRYALSASPQYDYGKLFFAVRPEATESYSRKEVAAVAFWLHSGDDYLPLSALAVTVVGSNSQPYWVEDDKSVTNTVRPVFSETRLYFLDYNDAIPPRTWTEVTVWLDDLIYDPDYEFVTGVYIKNDEGFLQTFYVDNLRLIMTESES